MISGDPHIFALESEISEAYERLSLRALGFFVIHISGRSYGVRAADATMLASSFDGVVRRIAMCGTHCFPAISNVDAQQIATAFSRAVYLEHDADQLFLGMRDFQFKNLLFANNIVWAPDGDEAFDDGSCVLQFDVGTMVRLIAFNRTATAVLDPGTLQDILLPQIDFYEVLREWHERFEDEWKCHAKCSTP